LTENLQGFSPFVAGLALLPQGMITGFGTVFGSRLSKRKGVRFCAVLGMAILTVCTAALLLVESNTPAWLTAIILSGRGLALGLTIQPLLNTMLRSLSREEMPDGNTLFNVAERLGGSVGIPLVATFFTVRESARIGDVLNAFGLHITSSNQGGSLSALAGRLPAPLFAQLTQAATAGFHDTIWLLVGISALGLCAALLLRDEA
jgi:predicted MFS family arabinose efflux permease